MLSYFILGVALFAGLLLAGHWFATADPKRLAKALKWLLIGLIVTVILFFVFTGRLAWAFFALPALLPWIMRARAAARMARNFQHMAGAASGGGPGGGPGSGQASTVETRFLHMTLDHTSGAMDGDVVEGPFAGRRLGDLTLPELLVLLQACAAADAQSEQVLEAYLDRNHPDWRDHIGAGQEDAGSGGGRGSSTWGGAMTREEALQVLGLEEGADEEAIKAAYHRLMGGLHPDHGGSTYLATKLNQARDILIGNS